MDKPSDAELPLSNDGEPIPPGPHAPEAGRGHRSFWLWVMCLTGVDYFSTLGYQPSIAFDATGVLAPLATVILVAVTLLGALPVYIYVAKHSPHGQGSISMLEKLVSGWGGKALVLVLLGFTATSFVITKTLSAADAAEHIVANPLFIKSVLKGVPQAETAPEAAPAAEDTPLHKKQLRWKIGLTMFLLVLLGAMFLRGFREVILLAVVIAGTYLVLNAIVVGGALIYLFHHSDLIDEWWQRVQTGQWYIADAPATGTGAWPILIVCLMLFPKLALGLSGFETGVAVMPLVKGDPTDTPRNPSGRIRNTRKLLASAALIMSVFLLGSSLVVSTLIPPKDLVAVNAQGQSPTGPQGRPLKAEDLPKPPARARALAYLAHNEDRERDLGPPFGEAFGTIYDISSVVILWFAGASAMAGLLNLVPQYLPRYGMAPDWARVVRPLVLVFTAINLIVTWIFQADVDAQGGAYATGVLMLITSACVAAVIERFRSAEDQPWWRRLPLGYGLVMLVFFYTTALNIYDRLDGIKIAGCFIAGIIATSLLSRAVRARELRFSGFEYADEESRFLWESIQGLELPLLVPHRPGKRSLSDKESVIRREHRLPPEQYILFIEVELKDPSEFYHRPVLRVMEEEGRFTLKITRAASISHTVAAVALELAKTSAKPPEVHFGWTDESPVAGMIGFLLFGEGNVPWMVHELIRRAEPDPVRRPMVDVGGV